VRISSKIVAAAIVMAFGAGPLAFAKSGEIGTWEASLNENAGAADHRDQAKFTGNLVAGTAKKSGTTWFNISCEAGKYTLNLFQSFSDDGETVREGDRPVIHVNFFPGDVSIDVAGTADLDTFVMAPLTVAQVAVFAKNWKAIAMTVKGGGGPYVFETRETPRAFAVLATMCTK
jgi:hypothetical protein